MEDDLVLTREITAVKINNSGRSAGPLYSIPAYARVTQVRPSQLNAMVEIVWQGESYAVFEEDLNSRAVHSGDPHSLLARLSA